ncbi:hypothetical protein ACD661_14765 [Legionella lytica]|uniref:Uncharacterized protein n=1 Tax=Legionella lytica TaxID=96232 RepID=A0ABW8DCA7_9GAMM
MYAKSAETLFSLRQTVLSKLSAIEQTEANADLLLLLFELVNEETLLSHQNMPSLLYLLNKPELPALINYVVGLDSAEISPTSSKGSFFAQELINKQHTSCIQLLRNVVAIKNNETTLWEDANGLLQNALLVYSSYHQLSKTTVSSGCCIVS